MENFFLGGGVGNELVNNGKSFLLYWYKESNLANSSPFQTHLKMDLHLKYSILDNYSINSDIYKVFRLQVLTCMVILRIKLYY